MQHEWGETKNIFSILDGKHEGKITLGRPRSTGGDNKMDLREIGFDN
jgi:hypothetical protein